MSQANLPVVIPQPAEPRRERVRAERPADKTGAAGVVEAQLAGQTGAKRGLKGGAPVLEAARSAYLEAEFSGEADRRLPAGLIARTRV